MKKFSKGDIVKLNPDNDFILGRYPSRLNERFLIKEIKRDDDLQFIAYRCEAIDGDKFTRVFFQEELIPINIHFIAYSHKNSPEES